MEAIQSRTVADLTHVPCKGNPQAITALIGGQLDVMFADTDTALPLVRSGKLRALAYTGIKRSPTFPGVPTRDESGVKGHELHYWVGAYVPRGTPAEIVKKLNNVRVAAVRTPAMVTVYEHPVLDACTSTPEEPALFQHSELDNKWSRNTTSDTARPRSRPTEIAKPHRSIEPGR
jgi:tripartite-type tricarboxylate transporter receptor subunit TctC